VIHDSVDNNLDARLPKSSGGGAMKLATLQPLAGEFS
jgi:hypothetical protein